jgi:hypothetical protein
MSKHTPGPWTIGALESGQAAVDGANGEEVTGFISPADAALIAAAPDMLAALEAIRDIEESGGEVPCGVKNDAWSKIYSAIARAKGTP